jgi:hypothetical protein
MKISAGEFFYRRAKHARRSSVPDVNAFPGAEVEFAIAIALQAVARLLGHEEDHGIKLFQCAWCGTFFKVGPGIGRRSRSKFAQVGGCGKLHPKESRGDKAPFAMSRDLRQAAKCSSICPRRSIRALSSQNFPQQRIFVSNRKSLVEAEMPGHIRRRGK